MRVVNVARNFLIMQNNLQQIPFRTVSKAEIQKPAEASGDLIGIIFNGKIKKVSKNSLENNLETVTNENNEEKPKERYISPEKRQEIFDDLRCLII